MFKKELCLPRADVMGRLRNIPPKQKPRQSYAMLRNAATLLCQGFSYRLQAASSPITGNYAFLVSCLFFSFFPKEGEGKKGKKARLYLRRTINFVVFYSPSL